MITIGVFFEAIHSLLLKLYLLVKIGFIDDVVLSGDLYTVKKDNEPKKINAHMELRHAYILTSDTRDFLKCKIPRVIPVAS